MDDLTSGFKMYRECVRLVWNCFLRYYPDGENEFSDVDEALCRTLFVSQLARYEEPKSLEGRRYYEAMKIVPADGAPMDVLCGFLVDGAYQWKPYRWSDDLASLRFHDVFDFAPFSGEWREFRYTEAIVTAATAAPFEPGQRVLLESDSIKFVDVSSSG